jgi:DNA mismatch repair protein MutL
MSSRGVRTTRTIALLPEQVQNQIAAGEVIERPASVVKELVENALDAGARTVRVDLEEGGAKLVRVVDDGVGMGPEDLVPAFTPHATSKLRDVDDLEHIASLGFRGEALASIGAVARASILSRPRGASTGHRVVNDWGELAPVVEAGGPQGTTIEVSGLFLRLPARRRFMKRPATELGRCLDVLQRLVVAHEGVGFVVTHDGKRVVDVEAGMDRRERVRRLFGADLADALVPVHGVDGDTELTGLVAPPRFGRNDTTRQMWFLNGRPLRDKLLIRVLKDAYRGLAVDIRQPVAFLSLSMDPARVDVNVHPTKAEVRFRDDRRLFGFLVSTLRKGLAQVDLATPGDVMLSSAARRGTWRPATGGAPLPDPGVEPGVASPRARDADDLAVYEVPGRPLPGTEPADPWERRDDLAGPYVRVARTYVVRELPDGLEIVDQHALHERVTFEDLKAQLAAGAVEVQRLLVPELVERAPGEVQLLERHAEALRGIGVHLEPFGEGTIALHGVPALLRRVEPEQLVADLVGLLERLGTPPPPDELLEEVLHSMACRSSVMAGDELTDADVRALLERAVEVGGAPTCPHGRPTRVRFDLADLEKAFHRR